MAKPTKRVQESTKEKEPVVTAKYHIEIPPQEGGMGQPAVYKVWFGKSYFIWKGKSLLLSATWLAESVERALRTEKIDDTNYLWHVFKHIKKTRCQKAHIEVVEADFIRKGSVVAVDVYKILKSEQALLLAANGDVNCLNNNEIAYIPKWMEQDAPADVSKFKRTWNK